MNTSLPIGIFDSGIGGLTVAHAIVNHMPKENIIYFGDTAHLPYGAKSVRIVAKYAISAAHFLEEHGIEMLVVACNTATALAFDDIREAIRVPVVGVIEPGAERAAAISKTRKVVVAATEATVASHAYQRALSAHGLEAREKACPLLVPLVEEGWVDHPVTEQVARIYLDEAFTDRFRSADILLLGCTHYPLLKPLLKRVVPDSVSLVDSAESMALAVLDLTPSDGSEPGIKQVSGTGPRAKMDEDHLSFFVTDSVEKFKRFGSLFLGQQIENIKHIDLKE